MVHGKIDALGFKYIIDIVEHRGDIRGLYDNQLGMRGFATRLHCRNKAQAASKVYPYWSTSTIDTTS